jgi:hypothetical protein
MSGVGARVWRRRAVVSWNGGTVACVCVGHHGWQHGAVDQSDIDRSAPPPPRRWGVHLINGSPCRAPETASE